MEELKDIPSSLIISREKFLFCLYVFVNEQLFLSIKLSTAIWIPLHKASLQI